jgi:hypothetical protein
MFRKKVGFLAFMLLLVASISAISVYAAGPRSWGKWGTATTSNATITVGGSTTFGPANVCVYNSGDTNDLYMDWTDGVATTDDNSTNIRVCAGCSYCADFEALGTNNQVQIGLITSSSTTTYIATAVARN